MSRGVRLWPKRAKFVKDEVVQHKQLPRLLGRILGVSIDKEGHINNQRAKVYYRIEWIDEGAHKMCPVVEQSWVQRIDPLTALASMG